MNQMDYGLKAMNEMGYGQKEINDNVTKWWVSDDVMMWFKQTWWTWSDIFCCNMAFKCYEINNITGRWLNSNLQSKFSLWRPRCWLSKAFCLTCTKFCILHDLQYFRQPWMYSHANYIITNIWSLQQR